MNKGPINGSRGIQALVKDGVFYAWFPDRSQIDIVAEGIKSKVIDEKTIELTDGLISFYNDHVMITIGRNSGVIEYNKFLTLFS